MVDITPPCGETLGRRLLAHKSDVRHRYDPLAAGPLSRIAKTVAKGVELFDVAQFESGISAHPAPHGQFQGEIAGRIERPGRQALDKVLRLFAVAGPIATLNRRIERQGHRQHARLLVSDGDDHRVEPDDQARFRRCGV